MPVAGEATYRELEAEVARLRTVLSVTADAMEAAADTFEQLDQTATARWARQRSDEARAALAAK